MPIRVLLADDHQTFRESVSAMLRNTPGMLVAGEAATVHSTVRLAQECRPDVVVLDVRMGEGNGLDIIRKILDVAPQAAVLMLTMHGDKRYVRRAVEAGAKGYLLKDTPFDLLCTAIQLVHDGKSYFSASLARSV
jgi:two-component system nitrate/nitrite response regulator NarL